MNFLTTLAARVLCILFVSISTLIALAGILILLALVGGLVGWWA